VLAVAGKPVQTLAGFFRQIWAQGDAGVKIAITIHREGGAVEVTLTSADRAEFLKSPKLQ
jgi:S1-C subfamily serine protease